MFFTHYWSLFAPLTALFHLQTCWINKYTTGPFSSSESEQACSCFVFPSAPFIREEQVSVLFYCSHLIPAQQTDARLTCCLCLLCLLNTRSIIHAWLTLADIFVNAVIIFLHHWCPIMTLHSQQPIFYLWYFQNAEELITDHDLWDIITAEL